MTIKNSIIGVAIFRLNSDSKADWALFTTCEMAAAAAISKIKRLNPFISSSLFLLFCNNAPSY